LDPTQHLGLLDQDATAKEWQRVGQASG
jgi:hypothetical protein